MVSVAQLFVGIDVAAETLSVEVGGAYEAPVRLEFANTAAGHKALIKRLTKRGRTARVCLEATGTYHLDLALALHRAGLEVVVLNPKVAKRFAEALGERSKTDRIDAGVLRQFAQRMPVEPWQPPQPQRLQLRAITRRIHALVQIVAQERNRLHAASACELAAIVRKDIRLNIAQLLRRIETLRDEAETLVDTYPELQRMLGRIRTIPGFARVSALQVLGEIAVLPADMTPRQWVAHAGLDPRQHESGTSVRRRTAISKAGNRLFRAPLYMPALVAIRVQPHTRAFYERLLGKGKKKLQAIVAVMRKLLHAIHAMLRHDDPFDGARLFTYPGA
jgi:transposase